MSRKLSLKKPKTLKTWLIPRLRRISIYWRGRNEAINDAKVWVSMGKFKNGKPKTKVLFECAECARQGIDGYYERHDIQADHIIPVANTDGFQDWNSYIEALFCDKSNFQVLCKYHHDVKTLREQYERLDKDKEE